MRLLMIGAAAAVTLFAALPASAEIVVRAPASASPSVNITITIVAAIMAGAITALSAVS